MLSEIEVYASLFESFLSTKNESELKLTWKLNSIVNIMEITKERVYDDLCENSLRIIMALFRNFEMDPYDLDKNRFKISLADKEWLISILLKEFT